MKRTPFDVPEEIYLTLKIEKIAREVALQRAQQENTSLDNPRFYNQIDKAYCEIMDIKHVPVEEPVDDPSVYDPSEVDKESETPEVPKTEKK